MIEQLGARRTWDAVCWLWAIKRQPLESHKYVFALANAFLPDIEPELQLDGPVLERLLKQGKIVAIEIGGTHHPRVQLLPAEKWHTNAKGRALYFEWWLARRKQKARIITAAEGCQNTAEYNMTTLFERWQALPHSRAIKDWPTTHKRLIAYRRAAAAAQVLILRTEKELSALKEPSKQEVAKWAVLQQLTK